MRDNEGGSSRASTQLPDEPSPPLLIAAILKEEGSTGVQTHVRQVRRYITDPGTTLVTPFSWGGMLRAPVFGLRLALERCSGSAHVAWYRHWHEVFLRNGLRRALADVGDCVVYAQCPVSARAALRARRGPHQRVVMAVHFRVSQADEWVNNMEHHIRPDGRVFRSIRQVEREVIPQVDNILYVSRWARDALVNWLPEAATVPYAIIDNFVAPQHHVPDQEPLGDLVTVGRVDRVKNHQFILEVLAEANRAGRPLTLDIFGEGPLRKDLARLTHSLGLGDQVRFRGFRRDVRDFLPRYRAYVHASRSESSSLAIMEAMAAGLPIVAGRIGAIPEICEDGVEARFWPLDDPVRATATLLDLLDCESARLKVASAARERFHRDYDAEVIAPRLRSFLLGSRLSVSGDAPPRGPEPAVAGPPGQ